MDQYVGAPKYGNVYRNFFLAKELQKKGYKVKIFSGSYSHLMYDTPTTNGVITKEVIDGVEFNWIKLKQYKNGKSLGRVLSIFEYTLKLFRLGKLPAPDIIITPSVPLIPFWTIEYLRKCSWRSRDVKVILEVRDLWPLSLIELGGFSKYGPFISLLSITEKMAYKKADFIISTLRYSYEHISRVISSDFKFRWIDNGINLPSALQNHNKLMKEVDFIHIPKGKFIIGYTGALGVANSMDCFIKCVELFKSDTRFHFIIIGDGYEKRKLYEMSKGFGNINFYPKINKELIPVVLKKFDVLYFSYANIPNLYKFGVSANKTYEYMISGKPIVLSSIEIKKNIVSEANCGIVVPPESAHSIQNAIKTLFGMSSSERNKMGENGVNYILKNNTFTVLSDKLANVFLELNK